MKTLKKLMMGALALMLGMTIAACSSSNNLSSKKNSIRRKALGRKSFGQVDYKRNCKSTTSNQRESCLYLRSRQQILSDNVKDRQYQQI